MQHRNINFDELINRRVNRFFVIDLFIRNQNRKNMSPLRTALNNKTIENVHKIYDHQIKHFVNSHRPENFYSNYNLSANIYFEPEENKEDLELCFINEERK